MPEEIQWCPRPKWEKGVPWCTEEECPEYDGKRCKMMGFRPSTICEPAVEQLSEQAESATARAEKAGDALHKIANGMAWPLRDDLPEMILNAVNLATKDAVRWEKQALEVQELLHDREHDLVFEHGRAEAFEKACDEIATALGWPILPHPEDVSKLVEAVVHLQESHEQLVDHLDKIEGKRDCSMCLWEGLDCNDQKPEGCTRWLCAPPGWVPKADLDQAEACIERLKSERDEFRRRAESYAAERPWTGCVIDHFSECEYEPAGAIIDFQTSAGASEFWLPLADIPEESREPGSKCRIEWSKERWTQIELDEARRRADELSVLFGGEEPPAGQLPLDGTENDRDE